MITQTFRLNLVPGGVKPRVNVSQYDSQSRTLEIQLYDGSQPFEIPSGASVYIQGTKADGTGFQYNAEHTDNVVTADVTEQMTAFAGEVETEIVIAAGGAKIASGNFILRVEPSALREDVPISETDIPVLETLPEELAYLAEIAATIEGGGDGKVQQNANSTNALYPLLASDTNDNVSHRGTVRMESKLLGNPRTGVLQSAGGIEVTDASGYYALTKRRTASDGEVHRATIGVAESGATTIEHYPSESGEKDARLEMASGKIEAKVGTFYQNGVEVADKKYVPFKFGTDSSGKYGYYKEGESTVTPFGNGSSESEGKVVQNPSTTNALYPMVLSDRNDNTQHTGIVRTVAKAQVNPSTGAIQTDGGINVTDNSGYYVFTKTRTVSGTQHKVTMGQTSDGYACMEHYPDASDSSFASIDGRLEIGGGKIKARVGTFYQNDKEVVDKGYAPFKFGKDSSGNYGYYKDGETTLTPFKTSSRNPTGNAAAGDVRANKTFSNASSDGLTGSLTDSSGSTLTASSASVAKSGSYAQITPALSERIVSSTTKYNVPLSKFGNASASEVASGKTFTSSAGVLVTGTHEDSASATGNASTSDVRSGKTFSNASSTGLTGGLTDSGGSTLTASSATVAKSGSYIQVTPALSERIMNASTKFNISGSSFGDAAASDVAKGKTFTSANGVKVTGTHEDSGSAATGDATAADVRIGKTFSNSSDTGLTGTLEYMANIQAINKQRYSFSNSTYPDDMCISLAPAKEMIVSASHSPLPFIRVPKEFLGDATTADVASGKTFTSANGLTLTGTKASSISISVYRNFYITSAKAAHTPSISNLAAGKYLLIISDYAPSLTGITLSTPTFTNGTYVQKTYVNEEGSYTTSYLVTFTSTGSISIPVPARSATRTFTYSLIQFG